jgi:hypothetical protein
MIPNEKGPSGCPNFFNCHGIGNTRNGKTATKKDFKGHSSENSCPFRLFLLVNINVFLRILWDYSLKLDFYYFLK